MKKMDILSYALYLLELRDRSIFEIGRKLKIKEFPAEEIDRTIEFLIEKKFLDDERFAKNLVQAKSLAGEGRARIKVRLIKAGIDREIAERELDSINPDNEYENALALGKKILNRNNGLERGKLYQKIMGGLYRKGYDLDTARRVIEEVLK